MQLRVLFPKPSNCKAFKDPKSLLLCSRVIGTWRPLPGTDPFIGEEGMISEEEELKVEVTVKGNRLDETLEAIKAVHPYEEPVINVIELYRTGL